MSSPVRRRRGALYLLLGIAAVIFAGDLVTKVLVAAHIDPLHPVHVIGDTVVITQIRNAGAAFSLATGQTWILSLVALGVVIAIIRIGRTLTSRWWALGLGLVLGGAFGNLMDRIFRAPGFLRGHVVDFIAVGWWPVFNVADSAITCGVIGLVALSIFGVNADGTRGSSRTSHAGAHEK